MVSIGDGHMILCLIDRAVGCCTSVFIFKGRIHTCNLPLSCPKWQEICYIIISQGTPEVWLWNGLEQLYATITVGNKSSV